MPDRPPRRCPKPRCPGLVRGDDPCPVCGYSALAEWKKRTEDHRGSARERGYDGRWEAERAAYLAGNPWCVICLLDGRKTPSEVVDHIIPHKGNMTLFWDKGNWQATCGRCHRRKSAREDGAFGNPTKKHR